MTDTYGAGYQAGVRAAQHYTPGTDITILAAVTHAKLWQQYPHYVAGYIDGLER